MQLEIKKCAELQQSFKFETPYTCQPRVDNIAKANTKYVISNSYN